MTKYNGQKYLVLLCTFSKVTLEFEVYQFVFRRFRIGYKDFSKCYLKKSYLICPLEAILGFFEFNALSAKRVRNMNCII